MIRTANRDTRHVTTAQDAPTHSGIAAQPSPRTAISATELSTGVKRPPVGPPTHEASDNPTTQTSAEVSAHQVLITEQQVIFSTSAVAASRREDGRLFLAVLRHVFAALTVESRSRPRHDVPRRMYYLERGLMAREMDRL